MAVLEPHQIGSGAAVNETNRELGGTLGVAVIGSVFASLFGPAIHHLFAPYLRHGLSPDALALAQSSMQAALVVVQHLPVTLQSHLHHEVVSAFMHGLHRACVVAAAVGAAGAVATFVALPAGPLGRETPDEDPARTPGHQ
jgi:Na+/H+-dicarboxylate symporter